MPIVINVRQTKQGRVVYQNLQEPIKKTVRAKALTVFEKHFNIQALYVFKFATFKAFFLE